MLSTSQGGEVIKAGELEIRPSEYLALAGGRALTLSVRELELLEAEVYMSGPGGLVQTTAFEIEDGVVQAIYIVRNPDKLRHLVLF